MPIYNGKALSNEQVFGFLLWRETRNLHLIVGEMRLITLEYSKVKSMSRLGLENI